MYDTSNEMANGIKEETTTQSFRMAEVTSVTGGVYLTFNGEESQRDKSYKKLSSYSPVVGDKVLVAKLNNSYTILGKVE